MYRNRTITTDVSYLLVGTILVTTPHVEILVHIILTSYYLYDIAKRKKVTTFIFLTYCRRESINSTRKKNYKK